MEKIFDIHHKSSDGKARTGVLHLAHGDVQTPVFMPVGTNATVKAMPKDFLEEIDFEIILVQIQCYFLVIEIQLKLTLYMMDNHLSIYQRIL